MAFDLNSVAELFSIPGNPQVALLTDWVESIHHAATYTDYLIVVPDGNSNERAQVAQNLNRLHGDTFDSAFQCVDAASGWSDVLLLIEKALQIDESGNDLLQRSERILDVAQKRFSANGSLMVVLDNCHQLSGDTLNQIAHFALLAQHRVVFALFGNLGFDTAIRDSPAHAMKQYLLRPDSRAKPEIVVHGVWLVRLEKYYRQRLDALKNHSESFRKIIQPMENGQFPLAHIIGITLLVIAIVIVAVYGEGSEPSPYAVDPVSDEVVLPDKGHPALVSSLTSPSPDKELIEEGVSQSLSFDTSIASVAEVSESTVVQSPAPSDRQKMLSEESLFDKEKSPVAVIQLLGVRDEAAVITFLDKWSSKTSLLLGYFESDLKGKPWFVVVAGRFTNKESARRAIHNLPKDLRAGSPWVREIDPSLIQP